jgi:hypothetical protein
VGVAEGVTWAKATLASPGSKTIPKTRCLDMVFDIQFMTTILILCRAVSEVSTTTR